MKETNEEICHKELTSKEVSKLIRQNEYCNDDSVQRLFDKYTALLSLRDRSMEKPLKKSVHNAIIKFINDIELPQEKEDVVLLLTNSLPHCERSKSLVALKATSSVVITALKVVSYIGYRAIKKIPYVGFVAKRSVKSLRSAGIEKAQDLADQAMKTDGEEIRITWLSKVQMLLGQAKTLEGEGFKRDISFSHKLRKLRKQYGHISGFSNSELANSSSNDKKAWITFLLALFWGYFGVDRFYLGEVGLGILKFMTVGGVGIWWVIDIFTAKSRTRQYNEKMVS